MKVEKYTPSHNDWLKKAIVDLKDSKILFEAKSFSNSVYHCQQCAEKILKAFLSFKNRKIRKTHDLVILVGLVSEIDSEFKSLSTSAARLLPYATKFRYPDSIMEPDIERKRKKLLKLRK